MNRTSLLAATVSIFAGTAGAQITITEVWQGVNGPDQTADWFELHNFGPGSFDASHIFFDDNSFDPLQSAQIQGIASIDAGETVIIVESHNDNAVADFRAVWSLDPSIQVGFHDGAGLSQGGDAVNVFDDNQPGANTIASQVFGGTDGGQSWFWNPDTQSWNDELSIAGVYGAYESGFGPANFSAIGSPGYVPSPSAGAVLALAGLAAGRRRR